MKKFFTFKNINKLFIYTLLAFICCLFINSISSLLSNNFFPESIDPLSLGIFNQISYCIIFVLKILFSIFVPIFTVAWYISFCISFWKYNEKFSLTKKVIVNALIFFCMIFCIILYALIS